MKLLKIKRKIFFGCAVFLFLASCKQDQIGPDLVAASSEFKKDIDLEYWFNNKNDYSGVNFNFNPLASFESTKFSEEVSWNFYIKGLKSGAHRKFNGLSDQITQTQINWEYGLTNTIQFFEPGEDFVGELHIVGLDTVFTSDTLTFYEDFNWDGQTINGVKHVVIEQFDINQNINGLGSTSTDAFDNNVSLSVTDLYRISGAKSLQMSGEDTKSNGWLGSINHEKLLELVTTSDNDVNSLRIDSGLNPDDLYINLYVFGDPTYNNTGVEIKIYENDYESFTNRDSLMKFSNISSNSLSAVYQSVSDAWVYDIQVNWSGWKLVSIPYSSFRAANSLTKGGGGNRLKESWRISGVEVSILSYPTSGSEVETYIDFLTLTQYGKPQY